MKKIALFGFVFVLLASFALAQPGDVNKDGVVDNSDLDSVLPHVGVDPADPVADVNDDESVDLFDLVEITKHMGP